MPEYSYTASQRAIQALFRFDQLQNVYICMAVGAVPGARLSHMDFHIISCGVLSKLAQRPLARSSAHTRVPNVNTDFAHGFFRASLLHCIFHCFSHSSLARSIHTSYEYDVSYELSVLCMQILSKQRYCRRKHSLWKRINFPFFLHSMFFFYFGWRDICNNWFIPGLRSAQRTSPSRADHIHKKLGGPNVCE